MRPPSRSSARYPDLFPPGSAPARARATAPAHGSRAVCRDVSSLRSDLSGESIQQAPDAVQNVERVGLTEGYKSKFPLFHKLFLCVVDKCGRQSRHLTIWRSGDRNSLTERFCTSDDPMADHPMTR